MDELQQELDNARAEATQVRAEATQWQRMAEALNTELSIAQDEALSLTSRLDAALNELQSLKATAAEAVETARRIIADPTINDADSCAQVDRIAAELLKNKQERELAAALQARAELDATIARLQT